METLMKAGAVTLVAAAAALTVKKYAPETAYLTGLAAALGLLLTAMRFVGKLRDGLQEVIAAAGLNTAVLAPAVKCTVIAVLVRLLASLSRDAGQSAAAVSVETLGAAAALLTVLPLIEAIFRTLEELL